MRRSIAPKASPQLERHVDEALRAARIEPGDRVLEVGCGSGRYTLLLARRGVSVEGLELSALLLERLRAHAAGRYEIPLYCADVLHPPAGLEGAFDAVLGFMVLHHVHDLEATLAAASRLLRPGGRMVFLDANAYNPLFYLQMLLTPGMTWAGDRGIARMRPQIVLGAFRDSGLRRATLRRFGFFPGFVADRPWGSRLERLLEAVPIWRRLLPFQLFSAERPPASMASR
jgi:SAM-dependent methyltransferase